MGACDDSIHSSKRLAKSALAEEVPSVPQLLEVGRILHALQSAVMGRVRSTSRAIESLRRVLNTLRTS